MTGLLAYKNGVVVPQAELAVSFADAGFASGATVTDFCRTVRGQLFRWPATTPRSCRLRSWRS